MRKLFGTNLFVKQQQPACSSVEMALGTQSEGCNHKKAILLPSFFPLFDSVNFFSCSAAGEGVFVCVL